MGESRKRTEVISTRLSGDELAQVQKLAGDKGISTYLREQALAAAEEPASPKVGNQHAEFRSGQSWRLHFAPGRIISIRRAPGYQSDGVAVWSAADARDLAAALLDAANVAERPDPSEVDIA